MGVNCNNPKLLHVLSIRIELCATAITMITQKKQCIQSSYLVFQN